MFALRIAGRNVAALRTKMHKLAIEYVDPSRLIDRKNNPQIHSKRQLRQLARSITEHGFYNPVIVDEDDGLIAGHGRVAAARDLGLTEVPCIRLRGLTEAQKRAIMLADNKIAANATTDKHKLAAVLSEILELDVAYDLTLTGYLPVEIDDVMIEVAPEDKGISQKDERVPDLEPDKPPVSQSGDIWLCRGHRIIVANALHREVYERLLGAERAQMVLTDPPYNLKVSEIGGSGKVKHREFKMASGDMPDQDFDAFLTSSCALLAEFSALGSLHFIFIDWRHVAQLIAAGERVYDEFKNLIVWAKHTGGMGTFYRSRHELICVFKKGNEPHINNFELGQHGRNRTNVWEYRGLNSGGAARLEELGMHPTVKPVRMLADAMLDCSQKGGIVLDPFGGSGSTMIAAEKTGRRARLIELDPLYVDCTVRRWQAFTKEDAVHLDTGETFHDREARLRRNAVVTPSPASPPEHPGSDETLKRAL